MSFPDLPEDLAEDICSRVPMKSLGAMGSTCKTLYDLSKNHMLGTAARKQEFRGFYIKDFKVCFMTFVLQGIRDDYSHYVNPPMKEISILGKVEPYKVFHCDGLLLCDIEHESKASKLVVWNPYLGQTWCIQDGHRSYKLDLYALGYDKNRNHKILRFFDYYSGIEPGFISQIYEFSSNSWRDLSVTPDEHAWFIRGCVSLKGNTYFLAQKDERFLLCFDFTTERFGPRLYLPSSSFSEERVTLSCVREEQVAVLYQRSETDGPSMIEIWVTNKIDPSAVSWSKFLNVNITADLTGFPVGFQAGSFFIDEEKKVAVVFDLDAYLEYKFLYYQTAHIIGEDGYIKSVIGDGPDNGDCHPLVFSSYVPSLVQLQINRKRKAKCY
ncbi:PREDICTED: F-box/kelch-repeat protein At3g13680-like [Camelina sativa]|uniref:F-box/kelch-repeat protein At3g13680-like n=1 Tax=Camelina sativa TaxID=90675 RepID=A0ABM0YGS7_CAMSA|nr:PREDICTED: F-box/kelch-repeat protein At3g13680-like [Camelina sativa]